MKTRSIAFFWMWIAAVILGCHSSSRDRNTNCYRVVCFHVADSFYRLGNGKFTVENIDPSLCTHLIYGYAGVNNNHVRSNDGYLDLEGDFGKGNYRQFNKLREQNPHLTTLLDVGGKDEGAIKFSELAKDPNKRKVFVESCVGFLKYYDFDGLNLDWQFPAHRGGVPEDKQYFTILLQELRKAFDEDGFVLTASVSAQKNTIDLAYEVEKITKIVDFLNVLTYDYSQSNEKTTGLASPLYADPEGKQENSVDYSVDYWLNKGADPDKLVIGLSLYGQSWTISSGGGAQTTGVKASGPGEKWPYTRKAGIIGFNEFCESRKEVDWSVTWREKERVSFATQGDQWITYDNAKSVTEKSKYVIERSLGGILLHGIESDDFQGLCSEKKFPLVNAAYDLLYGEEKPSTVSPTTTTTTTPTTTTTVKPPDDFKCTAVGYFRDPKDCSRYFQCINRGTFSIVVFHCPKGLLFSKERGLCDWKERVTDCA